MQIPEIIAHFPSQLQAAWKQCVQAGQSAQKRVGEYAEHYFSQSKFWQQYAKPLYERHLNTAHFSSRLQEVWKRCVQAGQNAQKRVGEYAEHYFSQSKFWQQYAKPLYERHLDVAHFSSRLQDAWKRCVQAGQNAQKRIGEYTQHHLSQSEFWEQYAKPLYERHLKPLDKKDFALLAGSLATASLIAALSLHFFTTLFPFAMAFNGILLFGTCAFLKIRVTHKWSEVAWEYVDEMRKAVKQVTHENAQLASIAACRKSLEKLAFVDAVASNLKALDAEIHKFREAVLSSSLEAKKRSVSFELETLKLLKQRDPSSLFLLAELEEEIARFGTEQQNLEAFERKREALQKLKLADAPKFLEKLNASLDDLVRSVQTPSFSDNQKAFLIYLESLQEKFAAHKTIDSPCVKKTLDASPERQATTGIETEQSTPSPVLATEKGGNPLYALD